MCGFLATFCPDGDVTNDRLCRALATLRHRGPDGEQTWIDRHRRVGLGHARLSIIDLTTGDQPIASEDESIHAVVNGELYDFERIRAELEAAGHRFGTRSDSEILVHLYEEYGTSCVHHLRGEFAFVLWDAKNDLLFAARDRFGVKPLYYHRSGRDLLLASEVKALFAAGVPARWDFEAAYQALTSIAYGDRSFFDGVLQVPPGHMIVASDRHVQVARYWDFDYPREDAAAPAGDEREQLAAFREVLHEAVRVRLRADVPVGCYLSGGLDSCAVLGIAQKHAPRPIRAFTISFNDKAFDEEPIAREMAAHAGAEFHSIGVTDDAVADHFADAVWHAETVFHNAHGIAKYLLSRFVNQSGYKVVLTGEGSDEILAGYPHFRRDLWLAEAKHDPEALARRLCELDATNQISRGLLLPAEDARPIPSVVRRLGFVPTWIQAAAEIGERVLALLAPALVERFGGRDSVALFLDRLDVRGQLTGRHPVNQSLYLWSKAILPNYILSVLGDRMEMANAVEGRVPFLDHHVVEAAVRLPIGLKIKGTIEKHALREATRDVLTDTVYRRQKHPFLAPPTSTTRSPRLQTLIEDTLRSDAMRAQPFFDPAQAIALLDRMRAADDATRAPLDPALLWMVSASLLGQRFGVTS